VPLALIHYQRKAGGRTPIGFALAARAHKYSTAQTLPHIFPLHLKQKRYSKRNKILLSQTNYWA
jgi:hypothetical protein